MHRNDRKRRNNSHLQICLFEKWKRIEKLRTVSTVIPTTERRSSSECFDSSLMRRKCLIWSPIWPLTLIVPCLGHIAIADSKGNVFDFQGTNAIGKNHLLFKNPTRVMQMARPGEDDVEWDRAVYGAISRYSHEEYNFL